MTESYHFFWGGPFSQHHPSRFTLDGERFATAEHYMMWRKARLFGDKEIAGWILAAPTPNAAKSLGRKVRGFDEAIWDAEKVEIVAAGSHAKYAQNDGLRRRLMNTAPALLVEASPLDTIWGVGLAADDPRIQDRANWLGENLLGQILTLTREVLAENAR